MAERPDTPLSFFPLDGMWTVNNPLAIPVGASPDMMNCQVYNGFLRKRPGYIQYKQFNPALPGEISGVYSTQDVDNVTHLYAAWATGLAKFDRTLNTWQICAGPALTGVDDRLFSFETSQNQMVFSCGADPVMVSPFNLTYAVLNVNCPAARYLTRFADRLFLGNTLEAGGARPFRVRRPVANDHTDWLGVGAGFHDLAETPHHVKGLKKIGTRICVYTERNIQIGTRTGIPGAPVGFEPALLGVGTLSGHTLKEVDELHVFLGNHGFMQFNGSQVAGIDLQLGDMVTSIVNALMLDKNFSEVLYDAHEYITFLCTGSSVEPDLAWVYNWGRQAWYPWEIDGPHCATLHRMDDANDIDSLIGTIDEQNWEFDSRVLQKSYMALLTGNRDGKVYMWSPRWNNDAGAPISCRWTSKDFTGEDIAQDLAGQQITLKRLEFDYKSGSPFTLDFHFSTNGGLTWDGPYTVAKPGEAAGILTASVSHQVTGNRIRFKFTNTSATDSFQIARFTLWFERKGMVRV